jgi:endonuclease/exonuclease/phosphatase family metal-dependent hydrolase
VSRAHGVCVPGVRLGVTAGASAAHAGWLHTGDVTSRRRRSPRSTLVLTAFLVALVPLLAPVSGPHPGSGGAGTAAEPRDTIRPARVARARASSSRSAARPSTQPTPPTQVGPAGPPVRVRFLQYNIRYGSLGLDDVAHDIERTGADVVMLNEIDDRTRTGRIHQVRHLARRLGMHSVFDPNIWTRGGLRGNAVLSTYPIVGAERHEIFSVPGERPRGLMRARVDVGPTRVDVWTSHLSVVVGKRQQARDVSRIIGAPRCSTVVGIDLNAGPASVEDAVMRTHLNDTWRAVGEGAGNTNFRGINRIDYVYYDRARPRAAWVTPVRHSDHRAVVADLDLAPAHSCL